VAAANLANAAKACAAERADASFAAAHGGTSFAEYGKRGNVFAKCVRKVAHAQP
jgi:hypothetical protein